MEQFVKYFYNIYIDKILYKENLYYFFYNDKLYYLIKNYRSKEELIEINEIVKIMINNGYPVNEIVLNTKNEFISSYNDNNYILIRINTDLSKDISLKEIINNNKLVLNNKNKLLYRNNWADLWSDKIDYFEYQINELGHDKPIILNSFSYYIGLAENAISIVNNTTLNYSREIQNIRLSHKRIKYPNMEIDYYNPLNFIFDIKVRDIAEYLKSMFFYTDGNSTINEFSKSINYLNMSDYEANMFFARLLYPSYYFDIYEKAIENNNDEELLDIISKVNEYELFLKNVYYLLSKKYKIEKIEWLVNKKEL